MSVDETERLDLKERIGRVVEGVTIAVAKDSDFVVEEVEGFMH